MSDPRNHHGSQIPMMGPPDFWMRDDLTEPFTFHAGEKVSAVIEMGDMQLHVTRSYNWFNRLMMRLILGWNVTNV